MAPAGSQIEASDDEMRFAEELITRPADYRPETEDKQEGDEALCDTTPDHVLLADEFSVRCWLGLVKLCFDDRPHDGVYERLHKDDAACPAVQEVEALVWDTCDHAEHRVAATQSDSQGSQSKGESTNAIGKATNTAAGVV